MRRLLGASTALFVAIPFAAGMTHAAATPAPDCISILEGVGAPGADVGPQAGAGLVEVSNANGSVDAVTAPAPQAGGHFGAAVVLSDVDQDGCTDLVVGSPGYDVGQAVNAGAVYVVRETVADGIVVEKWVRGSGSVPGTAQAGAHFGKALASYVATGVPGSAAVAMGAPGETVAGAAGAGAVVVREISIGGTATWRLVTEQSPSMQGAARAGDHLGSSLTSRSPCTDATVQEFEAGLPGKTVHGAKGAGAVLELGTGQLLRQDDLVGTPEKGDHFGAAVSGLFIGVPGEDLRGRRDAGMVERID